MWKSWNFKTFIAHDSSGTFHGRSFQKHDSWALKNSNSQAFLEPSLGITRSDLTTENLPFGIFSSSFFLSTSPREISCSSLKPQSSWSISRFFGLRASFMEYAQLIDFVVGRVVNCRNIHIEFFFYIYINSRAGEKPARSCPSWMPIFQSPRKCLHNFITFGTWRMFDLFFHLITYINCYR